MSAKAKLSASTGTVTLSPVPSKSLENRKHRGDLQCWGWLTGVCSNHSVIQYLLSTYYMSGTLLGTGDIVENRRPCHIV